jgi:hypothetical protein
MLPELKARIEEAAAESGRSLNAEIVARLEMSFDPLIVNVRNTGDMYAELEKIVQRTIRTVREEERKAGLPPLEHERPETKPGATAQPDALIRNPDGTYTVVEVKVAKADPDFDPDLPKPTHRGSGGGFGKMKP